MSSGMILYSRRHISAPSHPVKKYKSIDLTKGGTLGQILCNPYQTTTRVKQYRVKQFQSGALLIYSQDCYNNVNVTRLQ